MKSKTWEMEECFGGICLFAILPFIYFKLWFPALVCFLVNVLIVIRRVKRGK